MSERLLHCKGGFSLPVLREDMPVNAGDASTPGAPSKPEVELEGETTLEQFTNLVWETTGEEHAVVMARIAERQPHLYEEWRKAKQ